jgi:hypothetical protein
MARINIEIPDTVHNKLRAESAIEHVPIRMLVIAALEDHTNSTDLDLSALD